MLMSVVQCEIECYPTEEIIFKNRHLITCERYIATLMPTFITLKRSFKM